MKLNVYCFIFLYALFKLKLIFNNTQKSIFIDNNIISPAFLNQNPGDEGNVSFLCFGCMGVGLCCVRGLLTKQKSIKDLEFVTNTQQDHI